MGMARRGPHLDKAANREAQIFECAKCGHVMSRGITFEGREFSEK